MHSTFRTLCRFPLRPFSTTTLASPSTTPTASPLLLELHRRIRFHGPVTVAEYMRHCLLHPTHGYYTTNPSIFGSSGDFITSPQISPIFGELLAVFLAHHIRTANLPAYTLLELGPGTGSLLSAALPALATLNASPQQVALVERSSLLRETQRKALSKSDFPPVSWFDSLDHALAESDSKVPRVFVAHEFLDALPVHIFQRRDASSPWRERLVDVEPDAPDGNPRLRFVLAGGPTPATGLLDVFQPTSDATVSEVGAEAAGVAESIARAVDESGGLGLIVDYGADGGVGDSVRSFKRHAQVDVLSEPGLVDMTADVDFGQLRTAVQSAGMDGVGLRGPVTQREFLLRLGAAARFRKVAHGVVEKGKREGESDEVVDRKLERLQGDYDQLVGEREMGERFKVAVIAKEGSGDLAGGF